MTKTTNYNLPQWEAHDPLRREDFNDAMANIDARLADKTFQEQSLAWLRRIGYDLYQTMGRSICAGTLTTSMKGAVLNCLKTAEELSHAEGLFPCSGGGCELGPFTALSMDKLNEGIFSWENAEVSQVATPGTATVQFRSTRPGTITMLKTWYHRTCVNDAGALPLYVRLYDLAAGYYVYQSERLMGKRLIEVDTADMLTVAVPVQAYRDYRLELHTTGDVFSGTFGFGVMGTEALTGEVTGPALESGQVTESLTLETPVCQAVAVIHYSGGSGPAATVQGQAMTAQFDRAGLSLRGEACIERELYWMGDLSGEVTAAAQFDSGGADMTIHDVLFYFI